MRAILPFFLFVMLLSGLVPAASAATQDQQPQSNLLAPAPAEREPPVSRSEASGRARDSFPDGKVLSIRLEERRWRVRMDENGTVFNVFVDAQSGAVSRAGEQE